MSSRNKRIDGSAPASSAGAAGVPVDLPAAKRIASRTDATEYARSLPAEPPGSLLALFLSGAFEILAIDRLGRGSLPVCLPKPLLLVRRGLQLGAVGMVLVHHSPDRSPDSMAAAARTARELRRGGDEYDVHLLEYLILPDPADGARD